jgi:hypothetical protein
MEKVTIMETAMGLALMLSLFAIGGFTAQYKTRSQRSQ